MAKIKVGRRAPDVVLSDGAGQSVKLSDAWDDGRHALIIFLRHLA
ncbi:MAG: hypothetical protein ACPG8W_07440 [Candidatus Promineifilaceae bacterium]